MHSITKLIGVIILIFTICFNLWLYRLEPTANVDPNDNSFQYALVDRTNTVLDFAGKQCHGYTLKAISCQIAYLIDHWVPNWAQGYNLPYYYSHLPQIAIVASWRFLHWFIGLFGYLFIGLFGYYHWIIYLLLCFFPLSVFFALRVIGLGWIIAGVGAFSASQLSTDGLYGLDPSSFLWRGFGLSSQLFAMICVPLALAYSYRFFTNRESGIMNHEKEKNTHNSLFILHNSSLLPAVLFLVLTTAGHLGIGIMALLGLLPLAIAPIVFPLLQKPGQVVLLFYSFIANKHTDLKLQFSNGAMQQLYKLILLIGLVVLLLSYWIVPILLNGLYHNTSVWDPVWKFDSYGAKDVLTKLLAGDLFDFGRFPVLTIFTAIGIFGSVSGKIFADRFPSLAQKNLMNKNNQQSTLTNSNTENSASSGSRKFLCEQEPIHFSPFSFLFLFYLLLYFGRTTWGPLIDLIPGMSDFHISRFIVGVHIAGIFLVPIGFQALVAFVIRKLKSLEPLFTILHTSYFMILLYGIFGLIMILPIYKQTMDYASHNDRLIRQANENYTKIKDDTQDLLSTLHAYQLTNPGRVYAGRGGNWGKQFRVAETPMFMHISTYGIPTILWLPETWSPNSDTEQYFSEDRMEDYILYNLQYAVAPPDKEPLPFWKMLKEGKTWKLYIVESSNPKYQIPNPDTGYITSGYDVARIASDKLSFVNLVRLWIVSDYPKLGLYPRIELRKNISASSIHNSVFSIPYFTMLDEATYRTPDGKTHSLFQEPPVYLPQGIKTVEEFEKIKPVDACHSIAISDQSSDSDMIFRAKIRVPDKSASCLVILRQTYHPSWVTTVDGKRVESFPVFPFFTAVRVSPGTHDIVFSYEPSLLKKTLFLLFFGGMSTLVIILIVYPHFHFSKKN